MKHNGEKPHKCNHCDYSPIQVRDLKAHNTLWEHVNHIFFHTLMRKYNLTDFLSCTSNNLIYMWQNKQIKAMFVFKMLYWCITSFCRCSQVSPQIICTRGCKCVITLVTFVWLFSTVCFQMSPQISCLIRYRITLFAFVCFFFTVCFQTSSQMAYNVSFGRFVLLLSTVRFQMSPVIAWITFFFKILWLNTPA